MDNIKNSTAICVFVKTPGVSPVKTRLAKTIGNISALNVYNHLLKVLKKLLASLENVDIYWAINEGSEVYDFWEDYSCISQSGEGLGLRQWSIFNKIKSKYENILFIGADCPFITNKTIDEAIAKLKTSDIVFGPAYDGGYYLLGTNKNIGKEIWCSVNYSSSTTLSEFSDAVSKKYKISKLSILRDIDEEIDLIESNLMHWIN